MMRYMTAHPLQLLQGLWQAPFFLILSFLFMHWRGVGRLRLRSSVFGRLGGWEVCEVCEPIPVMLSISYSAKADSWRSLLASRRGRRRRGHLGSSRVRGRLALRLARQRRPPRTQSLMKRKRQRCVSPQCFQGQGRKTSSSTRMLACARERVRAAEKRAW